MNDDPLFARDSDASAAVAVALVLGAVTVVAALLDWLPLFSA